jgi:tryptophanyl-tRNA synthetase
MFLQSSVPEHAELNLLLSMVTPLGWLERVPTYKEALDNVKDKDLHNYGFLGYPILQAADIVMYGEQDCSLVVPVGEDQASHVEVSREIVRRANSYFAFKMKDDLFKPENRKDLIAILSLLGHQTDEAKSWLEFPVNVDKRQAMRSSIRRFAAESGVSNFLDKFIKYRRYFIYDAVLREPDVMLTKTPRIPGTDGRKMSKSYGNFISLSETNDSIRTKSRAMITDPARKRRTDPGNPDVCPVYDWHKLFSPPEILKWSAEGCRSAGIGCIECKTAMADNLIKWIEPVRARREEYAAHPDQVLRIIDEGSLKAREVAQKTMARVREAVFNWKEKRAEITSQPVVGKN